MGLCAAQTALHDPRHGVSFLSVDSGQCAKSPTQPLALFFLAMNRLQAGQKLIGFNERKDRARDDFYATPHETTEALLRVETFAGEIWEPCCGQGHIATVLQKHGYAVEATDLVDRGFGRPRIDFLMETTQRDNIVTNPPYGALALPMARQATRLAKGKVALLLKLQFLEGIERKSFFEQRPPARVWVFSKRQSLMKNGEHFDGGMMALAWFVWEPVTPDNTVIKWL